MKLVAAKVPVSTVWTSPDAPRDIDAPAIAAATRRRRLGEVDGHRDPTRSARPDPDPVAVRRARARALRARRLVRDRRTVATVLGQDDLGYPGWVPSSHLGELPESATAPGRVTVPTADAVRRAGLGASRATLSFATMLASVEPGRRVHPRRPPRRRIGLARGRRTAPGRLRLRYRRTGIRLGSLVPGPRIPLGRYVVVRAGLLGSHPRRQPSARPARSPATPTTRRDALESIPIEEAQPRRPVLLRPPGQGGPPRRFRLRRRACCTPPRPASAWRTSPCCPNAAKRWSPRPVCSSQRVNKPAPDPSKGSAPADVSGARTSWSRTARAP